MLGSFRNRRAGVLIWALLVALVIGLAGFGIGAGRGISSQNIARVGDEPITSEDYVRAMQQELRTLTQQAGRQLTMTEARQYGVDNMVLARLVNDAALDDEADAPRHLDRRHGRPPADHRHARLPRAGRQIRPRFLYLRARTHQPAPRRVRDPDPQRVDPEPDRHRRSVRRDAAPDRGRSDPRLPRREAQLRLAPARRSTAARAGPRPDRRGPDRLSRRARRRPLHPARNPPDQLRRRDARDAGAGHRDPGRRTARRLRRRHRQLPHPGAPGGRPHRFRHGRGRRRRQGEARRRPRPTSTPSPPRAA